MHVISTGAVDGFTVRCAVERPLYFASHGSAADSNSQSAFDSSGYKKIGCPTLCAFFAQRVENHKPDRNTARNF